MSATRGVLAERMGTLLAYESSTQEREGCIMGLRDSIELRCRGTGVIQGSCGGGCIRMCRLKDDSTLNLRRGERNVTRRQCWGCRWTSCPAEEMAWSLIFTGELFALVECQLGSGRAGIVTYNSHPATLIAILIGLATLPGDFLMTVVAGINKFRFRLGKSGS